MSINRQKLLSRFREEYDKLNGQQRKAVDQIEGPVMVIAGPGTGKTQILAARIGKILLETDALPETILCLTYTEAGALAMRRRLAHFIGSDAYKVHIYTFHGFCNDVIQENLSEFERHELDPVSELERIEILKTIIDRLPRNNPLKRNRGDVYHDIPHLSNLFSTMKREGWSPAHVSERIHAYVNDLPNRSDYITKRATGRFKKGDVRVDKIEEEKERMDKLLAAVNEFDHFNSIMRSRNRYDFDDMINWVIRAFSENRQLLLNYQERFQYILVDEYQDTSGSQNQLVKLLISFWDQPNVFVVGDDDQSIYRFQGANVANMEEFANLYSDALMTVVLTNNYRSTQPILDISKTLIERNFERLIARRPGLSKDLLASHPEISTLEHLPIILEYENQKHEMIDITMRVDQIIHSGVNPAKIAVLYKEHKYGDELLKFMRLRNIPAFSRHSHNLLELPLSRKIILILRFLAAEHDTPYGGDEMLFEILHFDFFGIPPIEIAKLSVEVAEKQFTEQRTSLRRWLYEKANRKPQDLFDKGPHPNLKKASDALEQLIGDVPNITLQTLFEHIVRKLGILGSINRNPEKLWLMQVLIGLFDFVKAETRRNPLLTVGGLITNVDLMEANNVFIPLHQVTGTDKGVNLLTAHGSKGLEFEYVFVSGCNASMWEKKRKPSTGYKFPDTIFTTGAGSSAEEELRRLFYVAITRAQKHLYITYAGCMNDGKGLEPSRFIAEILDSHVLPVEKVFVSEQALVEFESLQFNETAPEIGKLEEDFITHILDKFVMNVTALNNYLKCPLEFYYKNLIRIPSPKNEATEFGSSVHYALQRLFEKMTSSSGKAFPPKEELVNDFIWYMHRHRESFVEEAFRRRLEYGADVLNNYYDTYINGWNKVVVVERNIKNVVVEGVPLKGKLDKLEFDGKEVNVVDYKTGDPEKARKKLMGPHEKDPNGGDYWRQAVFYKILMDHYGKRDWKVVSTEFDFIEPDAKKKYRKQKLLIRDEDVRTVTEQIKSTWEKIQQRDFYTGCGAKDCHYCNFIKTNDLQVALHEVNAEEEEADTESQ
jgi:DNA helicase II / ATP-dependent DNA helicase PcrA